MYRKCIYTPICVKYTECWYWLLLLLLLHTTNTRSWFAVYDGERRILFQLLDIFRVRAQRIWSVVKFLIQTMTISRRSWQIDFLQLKHMKSCSTEHHLMELYDGARALSTKIFLQIVLFFVFFLPTGVPLSHLLFECGEFTHSAHRLSGMCALCGNWNCETQWKVEWYVQWCSHFFICTKNQTALKCIRMPWKANIKCFSSSRIVYIFPLYVLYNPYMRCGYPHGKHLDKMLK